MKVKMNKKNIKIKVKKIYRSENKSENTNKNRLN